MEKHFGFSKLKTESENNVNKEATGGAFEASFIERPGETGLTLDEIKEVAGRIRKGAEMYPMEVMAKEVESVAMGFITKEFAEKLKVEYKEISGFIASILDDMNRETSDGIYEYAGMKIKMTR